MASAALQMHIDTKQLTALYQAAKAAPGKVQVELRRGITASTKPLVDEVKDAASFSSRIPDAVKSKASFAKSGASVTVYVDPKKAPEAAPLNNGGRPGKFRHPVYGNDVWVPQEAQPFFDHGTNQAEHAVEQAMQAVTDRIAADLGFR